VSAGGKAQAGRTAYVNARLLDPASGLDRPGTLLVEGGRIAELGPGVLADGVPEGFEVVDCAGHCLAPGLVDMRAHLREPGAEHKETLASASRAAAAGGVTSIACMPNTDPVIDGIALIEFIARRARETSLVKIYPIAAITRGLAGRELTEMGLLTEAGAVGFSDADRAVADSLVMLRALSYCRAFDGLIMQHPEDPVLGTGDMNAGELATRLGLSGIPNAAEVIVVERDLRLVEMIGGRYHVAHLSTREAIAALGAAKARGLAVTCAVAAHHFALNETSVDDYRTFAKVSPPLRAETDRQAAVAGLADGTIDVIVSDHAPHDEDSKRLPFAQADNGIVGLETMLPLALELYHDGKLSLLDLLGKMTVTPARLLGLSSGVLAAGAPADLVLFDLERPWRIDVDALHSKSRNAPYDGRPVQGRVLRTVVSGRTVFTLPAGG